MGETNLMNDRIGEVAAQFQTRLMETATSTTRFWSCVKRRRAKGGVTYCRE